MGSTMIDKTEAQPEALRLAAEFEDCIRIDAIPSINDVKKSAAELRRQHAEIQQLKAEKQHALDVADAQKEHIAKLEAQLTTQTNRAAAAEQQVTALTQRLDMANRLNTDAREQLAQLSARQAAPDWIEELAQSWDECMYDAPGEMIDIGASIRKAASRATPPPPEREPLKGDTNDNP